MIARALGWAGICVGTAVGALGAVAAPGVAMGGLFCAAALGVLTYLRLRDITAGGHVAKAAVGRRGGLIVGCVVVIGWVVLTGAAQLLGPAAGAILLPAVLMTGTVLWQRLRDAGERPSPWLHVQDLLLRGAQPRAAAPIPAALTTAQLCLAWQYSYFTLIDLPADGQRTAVVRLREQLLDELERRDPAGFTRWIDAGARPGGDPGRFVVDDR